MKEMKNRLAAVGALSLDTVNFHNGQSIGNVFGGSAGYAAMGASFFTDVLLISNVGRDYPGEFLNNLNSSGIDTTGVEIFENEESTRFSINYDEELVEKEGTLVDLNVLEMGVRLPDGTKEYRYVYVAGNDPTMQLSVLKELKPGQVKAVSTHMHWVKEKPELVREVIRNSDIVFIDEREIRQLTGIKQLKKASSVFFDLGISVLVVKKGEHGALLFQGDRVYPFIAYDRLDMENVDPTGCGGVLVGAFLGFLAKNDDMAEPLNDKYFKALAFGLVVRSFKIEAYSYTRLLDLDREDIWRRYDQFRDILLV